MPTIDDAIELWSVSRAFVKTVNLGNALETRDYHPLGSNVDGTNAYCESTVVTKVDQSFVVKIVLLDENSTPPRKPWPSLAQYVFARTIFKPISADFMTLAADVVELPEHDANGYEIPFEAVKVYIKVLNKGDTGNGPKIFRTELIWLDQAPEEDVEANLMESAFRAQSKRTSYTWPSTK